VKYNIQKLNEVAIGDSYVEKLARELQNSDIIHINYNRKIDMIWNKTKEAVINSAIETLRMEPKKNYKNWFNDIRKNAIAERNELRKKALEHPSDECVRKYEEQRKLTNKTLRREKRLHEKKKVEELETNRYNARMFFKMTGELKDGLKPQTRIIIYRDYDHKRKTYHK